MPTYLLGSDGEESCNVHSHCFSAIVTGNQLDECVQPIERRTDVSSSQIDRRQHKLNLLQISRHLLGLEGLRCQECRRTPDAHFNPH